MLFQLGKRKRSGRLLWRASSAGTTTQGDRLVKSANRPLASLLIGVCAANRPRVSGASGLVFTSQPLDIAKSALSSATTGTDKILIPVAFFLIKHPKDNILFDTGDNDKIMQDQTHWGPLAAMLDKGVSADLAIDTQLEKVGVKPSDINYVILGHMHRDHAGNVGKFSTATIIIQRDEIENAFWPKPGTAGPYITSDFSMLRSGIRAGMANKQPTIELNGDLDLFGDGSVYIHRAVSHRQETKLL